MLYPVFFLSLLLSCGDDVKNNGYHTEEAVEKTLIPLEEDPAKVKPKEEIEDKDLDEKEASKKEDLQDIEELDELNKAPSGEIDSFDLINIPFLRQKGFQKIEFDASKDNTTEFLLVSTSHGNPGDVVSKKSVVQGGGWQKISYAGNDDRSIEAWFRHIKDDGFEDSGKVDARNGKGKAFIITISGVITPGRVVNKKFLSKSDIVVKNDGAAKFLVVAVSDNGKTSDMADEEFGSSDDKIFVYLTDKKNFQDDSTGGIRGAVTSIALP